MLTSLCAPSAAAAPDAPSPVEEPVVVQTASAEDGARVRTRSRSSSPAFDAEVESESDGGSWLVAGGAAAGTVTGAAVGFVTAASVLGMIVLMGGIPGPGEPALLLTLGVPFYVFPMLAGPAVGAAIGALFGGLADGREMGPLLLEAVGAWAGAFGSLCVCSLPLWWVFAIPAVLTMLILGDAFLVPALGAAACGALTTATCVWTVSSAAASYGVGEFVGGKAEDPTEPAPRARGASAMVY